ncbi:MAG: DEAD/DEAH box helicase [Chlamydiota bacterium]
MFYYSLEEENSHLIIKVEVKSTGPKRLLYRDTLLQTAKGKELDAVRFLIQEELRARGLSPLSSGADTISFNRVKIPFKRSFEALKLIGLTGNLFFKGKKLFVDPFTRLSLSFEVDDLISGIVHLGTRTCGIDHCEAIFPGEPVFAIIKGTLHFFADDVAWDLVQLAFPTPRPFSKKIAEDLADYEKVVWKKKLEDIPAQEPLPYLVLKDRTGAFADLFFDYGSLGIVAAHEIKNIPWRRVETEKSWEKDLLETDFIKKIVGTSHYYCPLDKVAKSLTFLLEIGWKVFDANGRTVVRQSACDLALENKEDMILVKGRVSYEHYAADFQEVIGAFNRRDRFVNLSDNAVGLLDPMSSWYDLAEEEIVSDGIVVKKSKFGVLEEHFTKKAVLDVIGEVMFTPPADAFIGVLHPYQQEGVDWLFFLKNSSFHGLLADEMGLGKTVQTIAFFSTLKASAPLLVVAPTSLLFNWRREFEKFLPSYPVHVHSGPDRLQSKEELIKQRIILTSYALVRIDSALLQSLGFECIVLDEAQMIKNPDSQVARAVFSLQANMRLVITGTPVENRSEDLFSLFHFLMPELLGERKDFQARLKAAESDGRYFKNIRKQIRPFILRRTKEVIADQLPDKIEQTVFVEMHEEQKLFYDAYLAKARSGLLKKVALDGTSKHRFEVLELILRLRQICCHPLLLGENIPSAKFERLMEDLEEVIQEKRKVLVYSQFTEMLQLIGKTLKERGINYAYLDGSTSNREEVVERFQNTQELSVFLISLKAGGVGLNLTAADYVFIFDPWWNVAVENQAVDRAHRLGRKDTVVAKRYVTAFSIEEKMMRLKKSKEHLSDNLLNFDEAAVPESFDAIIEDLLHGEI